MTSDEQSGSPEAPRPSGRWYKPLDPSLGIIHVEYEEYWENYSLTGKLVGREKTKFPKDLLDEFEEVDEAEAKRMLEDGASRFQQEEERERRLPAQDTEPKGIAGWLILPILGLLLALGYGLYQMIEDFIPLLRADTWLLIPTSGRALITFEAFANVVIVVGSLVLLVLLFLKRRILPKLMVGFYVFVFLAVLSDSIGILVVGPDLIPDPAIRSAAGWSGGWVAWHIVRTCLILSFWIPYFLLSSRVRNTFTNPPRPADTRQADSARLSLAVVAAEASEATAPPKTSPRRLSRVTTYVLATSLIVTLVVLALLVWRCAGPSAASGPTSDGGPTETYVHPEYGFSIDYPSGWVLEADLYADPSNPEAPFSDISIFDPAGERSGMQFLEFAVILLIELDAPVDDETRAEFKAAYETDAAEFPSFGVEVIDPLREVELGSLSGYVTTTSESIEGVRVNTTAYVVWQSATECRMLFQAAKTNWEKYQPTFEAIAASLRLTESQ